MITSKRAAVPSGGIVMQPPITQETAENILGEVISDQLWREIEAAFATYGKRLRALETSKMSRNKNDPESWHVRKSNSVGKLETAMRLIREIKDETGDFLTEAATDYTMRTYGRSLLSEHNPRQLLRESLKSLQHTVAIVERALPMEVDIPTKEEAERLVVRMLRDAFVNHGVNASVSDGRNLPEDAAESELTLFEQFVAALEIHDAETPNALSRWLRRTLKGETGGKPPPTSVP